ncbi:caprin-1-like isoform X2 [Argiope bruennichi]|uniref:Caprin-1 like protein n=1 Tax=Argiope bruennichi TaxID=94029 RepID=A0A8T0FA65_ARGBR|nr:caprin-1-like isoform X2 [Argiope bruennichi]KAF8786339.1 Caprin-1 like protein [Argiope bruennichi]
MPSASTKLEKQTSMEAFDPMKQIVTIVEKKVRNLEKRKGKLDTYRHDSQNGKELNEDQKKAVEKYDLVVELLEFAKELQKQFQTVVQENTKAQKKAAKREQLERQQQELQRIKEIMVYQDLLNSMGGDDIRQDFLEGNKGAVKLTEEELNSLDELYKTICPERDPESDNSSDFDTALSSAAEHIQALLDAKNKEAFGTTYKALRETLQKIHSCSYFNKSEEEAPNETESNVSEVKEEDKSTQEQQSSEVEDFAIAQKNDEFVLQKSGATVPHAERPYYPVENAPVYPDQAHPIQEVLSGQGNLNFLQESQIEITASSNNQPASTTLPGVSYANVQFTPAPQSIAAANIATQHRTRRSSEEAIVLQNHSAAVLNNSAPLQQQQLPPQQQQQPQQAIPMQPTTQPADFDPGRPIPTQTFTNQSFSNVVHPMMAVPQNYVPVTLPHGISPAHVLPTNMVVPPRSAVSNPNMPMATAHVPVSGLSTASALSQQANFQSLCLKMNQLNTESSQPIHVPPQQYEINEIQETKHAAASFGNGGGNHTSAVESRNRPTNNAYARSAGQVEYANDRAYQSTNNSQAYMNRENFVDSSSYSSNLKRGLTSRGGARGTPRGTGPRGGRVAYRN